MGSDMVFRIDGLKDEASNSWFYYSYGQSPAFSGLDWLINADTLTGLNSLVVSNMVRINSDDQNIIFLN